jgi:hypothetical protein
MMRNMDDKHMIQNVYSEPRVEGEGGKQFEKKKGGKPFRTREEYEESYHSEKQKEGPELDEDGFEIVGTEKSGPKKHNKTSGNRGPYVKGPKREYKQNEGYQSKKEPVLKEHPSEVAARNLKNMQGEVKIALV